MGEGGGAEELLRQVLSKLEELSARISRIEAYLSSVGISQDVLRIALQLASATTTSLASALEYAMRAWRVLEGIAGLCPISRSIVIALSDCSELSVSDVYRRVRRIRGRASRRTISERLRFLEDVGVVVDVGTGARPRYVLRVCTQRR